MARVARVLCVCVCVYVLLNRISLQTRLNEGVGESVKVRESSVPC